MSLYASTGSPERIADARLLAEIETVAKSIIVGPQRLMSYRPPNNPRSDVRSNRRLQLILTPPRARLAPPLGTGLIHDRRPNFARQPNQSLPLGRLLVF